MVCEEGEWKERGVMGVPGDSSAREVVLGVLASGRGTNLQAIIDATSSGLLSARLAVVVSDNDGAHALQRARQAGVEALHIPPGRFKTKLEPEIELQYAQALKDRGVELVLLAGFMRVLHKEFLGAFPDRILNIHPSLLPSFPGLKAQKQAWDYGAKVAGCTVHIVNDMVDGGPIILQRAVQVMEDDTPDTLAERILREEHISYVEAVKLYCEGRLRLEGRRVLILPGP
jgi:phosphoribosylglycinamide formyltransferase-1